MLQQRIDRARYLHRQGYNCAQCVALAFDDKLPMEPSAIAAMTAAMGGGIAATGSVCGALNAMTAVRGAMMYGKPSDKPAVYTSTRSLVETFARNNGSTICRQLKSAGRKPCIDLIVDAITILHNSLEHD